MINNDTKTIDAETTLLYRIMSGLEPFDLAGWTIRNTNLSREKDTLFDYDCTLENCNAINILFGSKVKADEATKKRNFNQIFTDIEDDTVEMLAEEYARNLSQLASEDVANMPKVARGAKKVFRPDVMQTVLSADGERWEIKVIP